MLRLEAEMLRIVHEWLPLAIGMMPLGRESQHPDPERQLLAVLSEHIYLGNRLRRALTNAVSARFETSPSGDTPRAQASQNR